VIISVKYTSQNKRIHKIYRKYLEFSAQIYDYRKKKKACKQTTALAHIVLNIELFEKNIYICNGVMIEFL